MDHCVHLQFYDVRVLNAMSYSLQITYRAWLLVLLIILIVLVKVLWVQD